MTHQDPEIYDLFIIGGGINGCGIARDAAGRGITVALAEMNDLASATSSSSTKLFHGGLRYLEYFEFRLVREALIERENLLCAMPHISWPMRFVLPYHKDMRFEGGTPTSRLMERIMPWMRGRRPSWLIRLGLFMYDHLGGRKILPGTTTLNLRSGPEGIPLNDKFERAYEYSDCWVEDSRLVVLNAQDAARRGAHIMTRTEVLSAQQSGGIWTVQTSNGTYRAKLIVNAGGPWVGDLIRGTLKSQTRDTVRLVRGSHIVTQKLYNLDKCYFFQGTDGRIIFAIPYETDFTLIGTTDVAHSNADETPECTPEEQTYLINFANQYFKQQLTDKDVVWSYSGVRPLYDDGASNASAVTREYVLKLDQSTGAPVLNIFGGKITTYRKLAEAALSKIAVALPNTAAPWTKGVALPGGDFPVNGVALLTEDLQQAHPGLDPFTAKRLIRAYGTQAADILQGATVSDFDTPFGPGITARELDWSIANEWTRSAEDFLWRRSKLGLRLSTEQVLAIDKYIQEKLAFI